MMMLRAATIFLCTGLIAIRAEGYINQTTIGLDPSLSAGEYALCTGRYDEGVALTLEGINSIKTSRDQASAFNNLCAGYVGTRQYTEALEACDKALVADDRSWRIYNNRALALLGNGRIEAARDELKKGFEINPDSPTLARVAEMIDAQAASQLIAKIDTKKTIESWQRSDQNRP